MSQKPTGPPKRKSAAKLVKTKPISRPAGYAYTPTPPDDDPSKPRSWVMDASPPQLLPARFRNAGAASVVKVPLTDPQSPWTQGEWVNYTVRNPYVDSPILPNTVLLAQNSKPPANPTTYMHELGHSAWYTNDLTDDQRVNWERMFPAAVDNYWNTVANEIIRTGKPKYDDPDYPADTERIADQYGEDASHGFAEAFARYTTQPEVLKHYFPEMHSQLQQLFGGGWRVDPAGRYPAVVPPPTAVRRGYVPRIPD